MPSELDLKFDDMLARVIGPGGRLIIGEDEQGRAIVTNFPATLPTFFRTFCALNAQVEAIVAGEERLTFADLDLWSEQLAHALASRTTSSGVISTLTMPLTPRGPNSRRWLRDSKMRSALMTAPASTFLYG